MFKLWVKTSLQKLFLSRLLSKNSFLFCGYINWVNSAADQLKKGCLLSDCLAKLSIVNGNLILNSPKCIFVAWNTSKLEIQTLQCKLGFHYALVLDKKLNSWNCQWSNIRSSVHSVQFIRLCSFDSGKSVSINKAPIRSDSSKQSGQCGCQ